MNPWSPDTYRKLEAVQQPEYPSREQYEQCLERISRLPPVVFPGEIESLKQAVAEAGEGRAFILQGGDCVELFSDCNRASITNKLKILLQMSVVLTYAARCPVIKIGRIAGQFFKPRSSETEMTDSGSIPVYRGDGINGIGTDPESRTHDPKRLESAYFHAASTLNYIRAMISGGFADLHHPHNWNLHDMSRAPRWSEYEEILDQITDAVSFMESFGGARGDTLGNIDFYTSHEALHLGYESALTRDAAAESGHSGVYNLGAHMLWIGDRTRRLDQAHVEYARGIGNPIGLKIGPDADPGDITEICRILATGEAAGVRGAGDGETVGGGISERNGELPRGRRGEKGKLLLITRLGSGRVRELLPPLIEGVRSSGVNVVWSCDPMHGNTRTIEGGVKTRHFDDVLSELASTFTIHDELESRLSGVHFELTGENVTECIGGGLALDETDLSKNYRSYCDPRLNYVQSMEMSFLISRYLRAP